MPSNFTVSLERLIKDFSMESVYLPAEPASILISSSEVNRPGLFITGFYDYFDPDRIQILGRMETAFLSDLSHEVLKERIDRMLSLKIPALVVTRGMEVFPEIIDSAKENQVPVIRTQEATSSFMAALISYLNVELAPRITRHGVLVEVYGEGMLILGDSGVGKSETAIDLIKHGHRLIADDAVDITKMSPDTLVGSSPELIRYYVEMRGIGVIDVRHMFGISAVKESQTIDLIVNLELWRDNCAYDRLGLEEHYTTLLDVQVPTVTIPVKPGRSLAIIIEVAAMNNRQKKMGFNAAKAFTEQLDAHFGLGAE